MWWVVAGPRSTLCMQNTNFCEGPLFYSLFGLSADLPLPCLCRALAADPSNLDVLLSLGVSHTNELEQGEALGFLRQWVLRHPKHAAAAGQLPAPGDSSQAASYVVSHDWVGWAAVGGGAAQARGQCQALNGRRLLHSRQACLNLLLCAAVQAALFEAAARASPQDGDVHSALGVVYNLGRQYDEAVQAFRCASRNCRRLWQRVQAVASGCCWGWASGAAAGKLSRHP